jgi:hypothetical protein
MRKKPTLADKLYRICADDALRRELLWLRAQERGDDLAIELLEGADPGLRPRMRELVARYHLDLEPHRRLRREAFAQVWDRRVDQELSGDGEEGGTASARGGSKFPAETKAVALSLPVVEFGGSVRTAGSPD